MPADQNNLIWIDMEMTGLTPDSDRIIEVAILVTNPQLEVIAEGPVLVVHQPDEVLEAMDTWNRGVHGKSGLIAKVKASRLDEAAAEAKMLEFHGTEASVIEQAEMVQEIAKENGGLDFQWATRPEERTKLWEARHNAYFACLQLKAGSRAISTDVCVPISRLAECIVETTKDIEKASMPIPLFGHVGDGNFHCVILIDPASKSDMEEARAFNLRVVKRALAMEGTCTGEHGIGIGKQSYLVEELGEAVELMRDIKRTFDPENLLNPGKVVSLE